MSKNDKSSWRCEAEQSLDERSRSLLTVLHYADVRN
jgi:hypothetical protein